jgi:hypothetical protein
MRRILAALAITLGLFPIASLACVQAAGPIDYEKAAKDWLPHSKAVFVGKVVGVKSRPNLYNAVDTTFIVEKAWKGISSNQVTILYHAGPNYSSYKFKQGNRYLVFSDTERLSVNGMCGNPTHALGDNAELDTVTDSHAKTLLLTLGKPVITFNTKD